MTSFKINRGTLSGLYVSTLICYFLFDLLKNVITDNWTVWFIDFMNVFFNFDATQNAAYRWLSLVIVCFVIVFLVYRFAIEVLDLHSHVDSNPAWESIWLSVLVFGFLIFTINKVFDEPMPTRWFTDETILLFGGDNVTSDFVFREVWNIVPWLWPIGPAFFMLTRVLAEKFKPGEK